MPSPAFTAFWKSLRPQLQSSLPHEKSTNSDDNNKDYDEETSAPHGEAPELSIVNDNAPSHELPPSAATASNHFQEHCSSANYYYSSSSFSSIFEDGITRDKYICNSSNPMTDRGDIDHITMQTNFGSSIITPCCSSPYTPKQWDRTKDSVVGFVNAQKTISRWCSSNGNRSNSNNSLTPPTSNSSNSSSNSSSGNCNSISAETRQCRPIHIPSSVGESPMLPTATFADAVNILDRLIVSAASRLPLCDDYPDGLPSNTTINTTTAQNGNSNLDCLVQPSRRLSIDSTASSSSSLTKQPYQRRKSIGSGPNRRMIHPHHYRVEEEEDDCSSTSSANGSGSSCSTFAVQNQKDMSLPSKRFSSDEATTAADQLLTSWSKSPTMPRRLTSFLVEDDDNDDDDDLSSSSSIVSSKATPPVPQSFCRPSVDLDSQSPGQKTTRIEPIPDCFLVKEKEEDPSTVPALTVIPPLRYLKIDSPVNNDEPWLISESKPVSSLSPMIPIQSTSKSEDEASTSEIAVRSLCGPSVGGLDNNTMMEPILERFLVVGKGKEDPEAATAAVSRSSSSNCVHDFHLTLPVRQTSSSSSHEDDSAEEESPDDTKTNKLLRQPPTRTDSRELALDRRYERRRAILVGQGDIFQLGDGECGSDPSHTLLPPLITIGRTSQLTQGSIRALEIGRSTTVSTARTSASESSHTTKKETANIPT